MPLHFEGEASPDLFINEKRNFKNTTVSVKGAGLRLYACVPLELKNNYKNKIVTVIS